MTEEKTYIVYARDTGGCYISERASRSNGQKYFWTKNKGEAAFLSYDAARKVVKRYGGVARSVA
jgi:hypothetical protein